MKNKIAHATSIQERIEILSNYYDGNILSDNIKTWTSRKSLCTEELFNLSLREKNISHKDFNLGIKELNENDMDIIAKVCQEMTWYRKAIEILENEKAYKQMPDVIDFSFALRPFLNYLKNSFEAIEINGFSISGREAFYIHFVEELGQIASKTLVYDLHNLKSKKILQGDTSNDRFVYYMKERFGSKNSMLEFFEDYPVLLRILTERTLFHLENYKEFIRSIEQSLPDIKKIFSISEPYHMSKISVGAGDSHAGGKTVILFDLNEKRFVFKYKNLEIGERFNVFLDYLEKLTGKEFYKINRLIKNNYCIEEFVQNVECKTKDEISKFYHRFGEYVALAYLLCGNDFHYENLIAHGEFPVLIDIETLIQNDSPVKYQDNPYIKIALKKHDSVLSSALLPFKAYGNRIEPLAQGREKGDGIRISAFDGKKQKSPYKGLGLVNINTDEVRFEYVDYELEGSNNIPRYNGEEVNAEPYKKEVVKGFEEICDYFRTNCEEIIMKIEDIFSDVIVRNVIKTTQKYADMIGYGYHPKCMKDYTEREKLFENLWAYEYKNKAAVLPEIKDLLVNDVPIFYNNTSSLDLITSNGECLESYYKRTAIDRVKERIMRFDKREYRYQKLLLELSLGIYEMVSSNMNIGSTPRRALDNILDNLYKRAIYDTNKNMVAFEDFLYDGDGSLDYNALNAELYDGLSGIYLFILYYAKNYPNANIEILKSAMERSLFKLPKKTGKNTRFSAYIGKYSILYPLYHKIKLEGNNEDLLLAEELLSNLDFEINQDGCEKNADWLGGVSGLIQVLLNYYKLTKKAHFLDKAEKLSKMWEKTEVNLCGFAHGYSGIIYAAFSLYLETGKVCYLERVRDCINQENQYFDGKVWKDLRKGKNSYSHWCHGTVGIGLTRLFLLEHGYNDEQVNKDLIRCLDNVMSSKSVETCLCHGNMGRYLFLKEAQDSEFVSESIKPQIEVAISKIINNIFSDGIQIVTFGDNSVLGLMTGITGIGYGLLRELNNKVPNILCLE